MEFSYTHVDYIICFQGSFWVRMLLLPSMSHLLIHLIFIPICLLAVLYLGYSDQELIVKKKEQQ